MIEKDIVNYKWDLSHKKCLEELITALNNSKIRYFILRNYEFLPEKNFSKDVDVIIEPGSFGVVKKIFKSILVNNEISNFYVRKYERAHCCYGIDISKDFAIHIDFIEGYCHKGYEIFDFELLYNHTHVYKNFRVLNDDFDILMLFVYKIAGAKILKMTYRDKIASVFNENEQMIKSLFEGLLGDLGLLLCDSIRNNNFDLLEKKGGIVISKLKKQVFLKKPIRTIYYILLFYIEKFWQIICIPFWHNKFIAVEAPDGTGKTTFIDNFIVKIAYYFVADIDKSKIYHFRPTILPNLGAVGEKVGAMKQDVDFTNPHRAKPVGRFSSFVRMCYYWVDYIVGMPIILRKNAQFDKITIFDRYIYDFLVDPRRSRINLPYWVRKVFAKLVKSPSLVFVLKTDADTIYNRKQELEKDEIKRQLKEFDKLSDLNNNVYFLDASKTPDEIADEAIKIFIDKFTEKLNK